MRILGIDPGAKGALALLVDGRLEEVVDMPTHQVTLAGGTVKTRVDGVALGRILAELRPEFAFLEQVGTHTGEGPMGAFSFGRSVGFLEGALGVLGLRATEVPPQSWKRLVGVRKGPDGDTKTPARLKAALLYPAHEHLFRRKKDDGRADAVLLASYGRLVLDEL